MGAYCGCFVVVVVVVVVVSPVAKEVRSADPSHPFPINTLKHAHAHTRTHAHIWRHASSYPGSVWVH